MRNQAPHRFLPIETSQKQDVHAQGFRLPGRADLLKDTNSLYITIKGICQENLSSDRCIRMGCCIAKT